VPANALCFGVRSDVGIATLRGRVDFRAGSALLACADCAACLFDGRLDDLARRFMFPAPLIADASVILTRLVAVLNRPITYAQWEATGRHRA
jgi:hypothetical protein